MTETSIPVDLLNPGQVFACLGFLEAADILCGGAEGGFDWTDRGDVRFRLRIDGADNPFAAVLGFIVGAELQRLAPHGYQDELSPPVRSIASYPGPRADRKTLALRLACDGKYVDLTNWCDGSSRPLLKLFAGQQSSLGIVEAMRKDIEHLWTKSGAETCDDPFGRTIPMGGSSFKLDARKSWTAIDAGFSPDEQGQSVEAAPIVEVLAAVGLEHARPDEYETRRVRYGVWGDLLPPMLARPAIAGVAVGVPLRTFRFKLIMPGKNKVVTFAQEETKL